MPGPGTLVVRKRVLHLINGEFYAGGERVQDLLALRLPESGYEVEFVCLKDGIFAEKRAAREAPVHSFPMQSGFDFRSAPKIAQLVKAEQCRLIHTHSRRSALVGQVAALLARVPMIHHVHSPSTDDTEDVWRNRRNDLVEKASLLTAKRLIAVSSSVKRHLIGKGYESQRIVTIANGVPMRDRTRLPFEGRGPLIVGTVALFRPRKGIEILLQALGELRRSGLDVRLHAVGPFETEQYRQTVLRMVDELGLEQCVHWTGFTNDVFAEFQRMHVFALPSLFGEGMPMVVLEAMAVGLPVISTTVEGIPEVVRDGVDGLLVPPGQVGELAEALRRVASRRIDAGKCGDNCWARQREHFSDSAMSEHVAAVYDEVLRP
jgi:phosphatidyl-myo-inositol alpha-mannosyltransferase